MKERKVTLLRWRMFSKTCCCRSLESKVVYKRELKMKWLIWATHLDLEVKIMLLPRNRSRTSVKHISLHFFIFNNVNEYSFCLEMVLLNQEINSHVKR